MATHYSIADIYKYKETLLPIEELKIYLEDIVQQIETELNIIINNVDGNCFNWRERKIPSFMNKYTSNDKIFLKINLEINKISDTNIIIISETIEKLVESYVANLSENKNSLNIKNTNNAANEHTNENTDEHNNNDIYDKHDKDTIQVKNKNLQSSSLDKCADYLTKNIYDKCYTQDISFSKNYIDFLINLKNKELFNKIKNNFKKKNRRI